MKIVLLSCVSKKQPIKAIAQELYTSPLFTYGLAYAKSLRPDAIYILSAKYGLLELDQTIEPYNETLNTKCDSEVRDWATKVHDQLTRVTDPVNDEFIFLAGERYRKHLIPYLTHVTVPLEGLGLGKQIQYLKNQA